MDTGCKHDLTTRAAIPANQVELISRAKNPVLLSVANELISIDKTVPPHIGELVEIAEPIRCWISRPMCCRLDADAFIDSLRLRLPVTVFAEAHADMPRWENVWTNF